MKIANNQEMSQKKIEEKLLQSENDYKEGKVKDASDVFNEWKIKYGI